MKIGDKINKLTLLEITNEKINYYKVGIFQCECGNIKKMKILYVKTNHSKSCGCRKGNFIHGMWKSDEYHIWQGIKERCYNLNRRSYKDYGGRGIEMCERWKNSFENFLKDMGKRPSKKHEIERINNNSNYYKENCIWATRKEQSNNKRSSIKITYQNQTKTLKQWSIALNKNYQMLMSRLNRGWSIEKTFTEPSRLEK